MGADGCSFGEPEKGLGKSSLFFQCSHGCIAGLSGASGEPTRVKVFGQGSLDRLGMGGGSKENWWKQV